MIPITYLFDVRLHSAEHTSIYRDPRASLGVKSTMLADKSDQLKTFADNPSTSQKNRMKFLRASSALMGAAAKAANKYNKQITKEIPKSRISSRVSYNSPKPFSRPNVPRVSKPKRAA